MQRVNSRVRVRRDPDRFLHTHTHAHHADLRCESRRAECFPCSACPACKCPVVLRRCSHYHAALGQAEREEVQADWTHDRAHIIVATIAFGMGARAACGAAGCMGITGNGQSAAAGAHLHLYRQILRADQGGVSFCAGINKPDVRFVMHFSVPKSLEGYHQVLPLPLLRALHAACGTPKTGWLTRPCIRAAAGMQETGRAGRDGKLATCILYYSYGDAVRMRHMLRQSAEEQNTAPAQLECNLDSLNQMVMRCAVAAPAPQPFSRPSCHGSASQTCQPACLHACMQGFHGTP